MRVQKFFVFLFAVLTIAVYSGCSKNQSTTASDADKAKAAERVTQANLIFVPRLAIIIGSKGADTSGFNMTAATSLYNEALTYDPENMDAQFGVAVTEFFTIFSDPDILQGLSSAGSSFGKTSPSPYYLFGGRISYTDFGTGILGGMKSSLNQIVNPLYSIKAGGHLARTAASQPFSYYQNIIETKALPKLADAITHLQTVTQHPNYIFYVTPEQLGQSGGDSIRIGLTEIYAILALCQMVDATASMVVAYDVDYDPTSSSAVTAAWQQSSTFLALRSGGAQRMKDARTSLLGFASSVQSGIDFLVQHPANGIIPYRSEDSSELNVIKADMDTFKMELNGPVQLNMPVDNQTTLTLTVNFKNIFDNPISNFKQELPAYTASDQPDGIYFDPVLTWQATSFSQWTFPDPSFHGIFPGITNDAQLKQTFGFTASGWSQSVLLGH